MEKLRPIKEYFASELSLIYTPSEIAELFAIFSEEILNLNKAELRFSLDNLLDNTQIVKFVEAVTALKKGIPYQYILGFAEFFGQKFKVSPAVLIPRPETEELLELAISKIKTNAKQDQSLRILEIGTGSGIIPIILKQNFINAKIDAIDFSFEALEIAKSNAEFHEVDINFTMADYLSVNLEEKYDLIISNPPYIGLVETDEIEDSVKNREPKMALFSPTDDALIFYRKIAADAKTNLKENGMVFLEINQKLGLETLALFQSFSKSEILKDISGNDRFIYVCK